MVDVVYHFTDTIRLPWIIESGHLRPSNNYIGNFPKDFLWAATDPAGDRTSAAQGQLQVYRKNLKQLIRITLPAAEFGYWRDVMAKFPAWTDDHIALLLKAAKQDGLDGSTWRCRADLLPLASAIIVEAKSYTSGR